MAVSYASGGSRGLQAPEYGISNEGPLGPGLVLPHVERHGIQRPSRSGAEAIRFRRRRKPPLNRVFLDIPHTAHKFLFCRYLALVEAAHPHIELAIQTKGEAAFDELHRFFKRYLRSRRDQSVEMVRHDDERMQEEFPLAAIVEDRSLQQFRRGRDLKKAAALRRHSCDEIRPGFLGREPHLSSINERPVAKATFIASQHSGA
jgi:hypothetical protein